MEKEHLSILLTAGDLEQSDYKLESTTVDLIRGKLRAAIVGVLLFIACPGDDVAAALASLPKVSHTSNLQPAVNDILRLFWIRQKSLLNEGDELEIHQL